MERTSMGELIRYYRRKQKISQEKLAGDICTRRQLLNIESGKSVPSLELIYSFSEILNIDLLETYNNVLKHNGLDTHLKYMAMDQAIRKKEDTLLEQYLHEYEQEEGFQTGEPLQMILHAKSILTANAGDFETARNLTLKSIQVTKKEFSTEKELVGNYSVLEIALLVAYATYTCLLNHRQEGLMILCNIEKYIKNNILDDIYVIEHQKPIWINLWCVSIYNEFSFSSSVGDALLDKINEAISYQIKSDRIYMLTEFLLCRASILMENKQIQIALKEYHRAKVLGEFYRSPDHFASLAKKIVNLHSNINLFEEKGVQTI